MLDEDWAFVILFQEGYDPTDPFLPPTSEEPVSGAIFEIYLGPGSSLDDLNGTFNVVGYETGPGIEYAVAFKDFVMIDPKADPPVYEGQVFVGYWDIRSTGFLTASVNTELETCNLNFDISMFEEGGRDISETPTNVSGSFNGPYIDATIPTAMPSRMSQVDSSTAWWKKLIPRRK